MCIPSSISVPVVITPFLFDHRGNVRPIIVKVFLWCSNNLHLVLLQAETWGSEDCLKVQSPALASNCKAVITLSRSSQTFARG